MYTVSITLYGEPIPGSPFALTVLSPVPDAMQCRVRGPGLHSAIAREPSHFEIEFVDAFGQVTHAEDIDCYVELVADEDPASPKSGGEGSQAASELSEQLGRLQRRNAPSDLVAIPIEHTIEGQQGHIRALAAAAVHTPAQTSAEQATVDASSASGEKPSNAIARFSDSTQRQPQQRRRQQPQPSLPPPPPQQQPPLPQQPQQVNGCSDSSQHPTGTVAPAQAPSSSALPGDASTSTPTESSAEQTKPPGDRADGSTDKLLVPIEDVVDEGWHGGRSRSPSGHRSPANIGSESSPGSTRRSGRSRVHSPKSAGWRGHSPARSPGRSLSAPWRFRLDANERQQHMTLWARRLFTEGITATKAPSFALNQRAQQMRNGDAQVAHVTPGRRPHAGGPSYAHELAADPKGVAFAFGGVDPGILHAAGRLVKVHSVHYSIGRAGKYRLHVGLRQQAALLKGSPFELTVAPGVAHATWTRLQQGGTALRSVVGEKSQGVLLTSGDRMGNRCHVGGAPVRVFCANEALRTSIIDQGDGKYLIQWHSEASGQYSMHVYVDQAEVAGSPAPVVMLPAGPNVVKFEVSGTGLKEAIAGRPAVFTVLTKDMFGNRCDASQSASISYGVALVSLHEGREGRSEGGAKKSKVDRATAAENSAAKLASKQAVAEPTESMGFKGSPDANGDKFEISYVAQQAGGFNLHVWCKFVDGGQQLHRLPGSPYEVTVSEGQASASGSFIRGADAIREMGEIQAGHEISLQPQLRDQFGNASSASENALVVTLDGPGGTQRLPVRAHRASTGAYEVSHSPELQGKYQLHVKLHEEPICDSPVSFSVTSGSASGTKSRLVPPTEPFCVQGQCEVILEAIDKFGNKLSRGGASVGARAQGNAASACTVEDRLDGTYTIHFSQNAVGDCKITARVDNVEVSPIIVSIGPKQTTNSDARCATATLLRACSPGLVLSRAELHALPCSCSAFLQYVRTKPLLTRTWRYVHCPRRDAMKGSKDALDEDYEMLELSQMMIAEPPPAQALAGESLAGQAVFESADMDSPDDLWQLEVAAGSEHAKARNSSKQGAPKKGRKSPSPAASHRSPAPSQRGATPPQRGPALSQRGSAPGQRVPPQSSQRGPKVGGKGVPRNNLPSSRKT